MNMLNSETSLHTMLFGTLIKWRDAGGMQPFPEPFPDAKVLLSYGLYKSFCDLYDLDCPIDHLAFIPTQDWMLVLSGLLQNQTVDDSYFTLLDNYHTTPFNFYDTFKNNSANHM